MPRRYTISKIDQDIQTDSFNCGVFICMFATQILTNNKLTNLENPNNFRNVIKSTLLEYSDDIKEICIHCGSNTTLIKWECKHCKRRVCNGCQEYYYKKRSSECAFCSGKAKFKIIL